MNSPEVSFRTRTAHGVMRLAARLRMAEPEILGLSAVVRPGDTVFDVGAAYGMYTVPLAALVGPGGSVNSFEPQKRQFRMVGALRSLIGARHVRVAHAAIGMEQGEHSMLLPVKFGVPIYGHTHVATGTERALTPQAPRQRTWKVRMETVDAWCEQHSIPSVSFLKVDVEGFEPSVLDGAEATITAYLPSLLLEIEDRHIGRYGRGANDFADDVRSRWPQYRMYTWSASGWTPTERVTLAARNYLFATDTAFSRGLL
ncbi:FkbM family methyltransferase [Homoserinimonas hongtaonis]|uniref:FkbM family methyltransferase n=1 Tax=Homoserinimonas hongtaonis TaxID=2079791 RepID=UPI000D384D5D|nr:FkbM family methyltransferase [Salinibacterium hongtaonis]AWB88594.1 FkbM family methyltransferase [Salinibacterium hongtaonis]